MVIMVKTLLKGRENIDRGLPIICMGQYRPPEWGLITGYTTDGKFFGRSYFDELESFSGGFEKYLIGEEAYNILIKDIRAAVYITLVNIAFRRETDPDFCLSYIFFP